PPRVRVAESGLETLAPVLFRELPLRALRRARLRHERLERGGPLTRSMGGRSELDHRRGTARGAGDAAGHFPGRGHLHSLRAAPPGARVAVDLLWRLRAGRGT